VNEKGKSDTYVLYGERPHFLVSNGAPGHGSLLYSPLLWFPNVQCNPILDFRLVVPVWQKSELQLYYCDEINEQRLEQRKCHFETAFQYGATLETQTALSVLPGRV
jgi:hypothetical protein